MIVIKRNMERFINVYDVDLKGIAVFDENLDVLVPLSAVRKALQMTPTADVVPTVSKMEQVKLEVAREIFEEIDAMCIDLFGNFNHRRFAELKKKYTEGKDGE